MPAKINSSLYPFNYRVQKTSGTSKYIVIPKQIVTARKIAHGAIARWRLREDGVVEIWFE